MPLAHIGGIEVILARLTVQPVKGDGATQTLLIQIPNNAIFWNDGQTTICDRPVVLAFVGGVEVIERGDIPEALIERNCARNLVKEDATSRQFFHKSIFTRTTDFWTTSGVEMVSDRAVPHTTKWPGCGWGCTDAVAVWIGFGDWCVVWIAGIASWA